MNEPYGKASVEEVHEEQVGYCTLKHADGNATRTCGGVIVVECFPSTGDPIVDLLRRRCYCKKCGYTANEATIRGRARECNWERRLEGKNIFTR